MARNKLAGTTSGKSKSARYFQTHPEARAKKDAYDKEYHATTERKTYRAKLNKANRDNPNTKGQDKSHSKGGKITNERRSSNRARQGKGGGSTKR